MFEHKKLLLIPIALLSFVCLFCIGLVVINMGWNEIRNRRFANQLYDYPLPPQTRVLNRETVCFCPPNGGTCVLEFLEVLETKLSQEEIESYYAGVGFMRLRQDISSEQTAYVDLEFSQTSSTGEDLQLKASIGEAFYGGGLFDWRCSQQ